MSTFDDPNQQSAWTPPTASPEQYHVPADAEQSNNADRWALIALAVSSTVLLSCVPGFNCLAPVVIGGIALTQARNAVNPDRARTYSWIATGIGILILLSIVVFLVLYGALIVSVMGEINSEFR